jgi:hypothetical protein
MGVHPKIVRELPGHSTVSKALDTCSHVRPSLQKEAANRLDTLLTNQGNSVAVTVAVSPAKTARSTGREKKKPAFEAG